MGRRATRRARSPALPRDTDTTAFTTILGDLIDRIQLPDGYLHDQLIGGVVGESKPATVDPVERDKSAQCQPLVPVHKRVVPGQRMH